MELAELTAYAKEKYGIVEERGYQYLPNCSVLSYPQSRTWIALLMRQWNMETGTEIERCDIRCGLKYSILLDKPYLSSPFLMRGTDWLGVALDKGADPEVVFDLFDKAVVYSKPCDLSAVKRGSELTDRAENAPGKAKFKPVVKLGSVSPGRTDAPGKTGGYTVVLDSPASHQQNDYQDTLLPFFNSSYKPEKPVIPERIREMRRMFKYGGRESNEVKAFRFHRQAVFMQDYEDDLPWHGEFFCFYPTYRDLTINQLRGYFTWRAAVRRGEFHPVPTSAAFLYVYELFNGVGASSPEESLLKLKEFEAGYLDSGVGDRYMRSLLRRSMMEFAIVKALPLETMRQCADPDLLARDEALAALRSPADRSDDELFIALCHFAKKKLASSPVLKLDEGRGKHLFCEIWRTAACKCRIGEETLFSACFGQQRSYMWFPLGSIVYDWGGIPQDMDYTVNECRSYHCRGGEWRAVCFENYDYDKDRFLSLIHAADLRLRRYLKTGHYLRDSENDAWALPYIDEVIQEDKRLIAEAARPKITVDLSGLDRIRKDAIATRNSLLTAEERAEMEAAGDEPVFRPDKTANEAENETANEEANVENAIPATDASSTAQAAPPDLPLDAVQIQILRRLLSGESVRDIIKTNRLMPSMVADAINEAMFDEIGDTVLSCEDDALSLVDDYRDDIAQLLGENRYE